MSHFPPEFCTRLQSQYEEKTYYRIMQSPKKPTLPTIRVNTLKTSSPALIRSLEGKGIRVRPASFSGDVFFVFGTQLKDLTGLSEYHEGLFYIQNPSSIVVPLVLNPLPGERVLDLAAAPGGKTIHMATLMKNQGVLIANDVSRDRLFRLQRNLRLYGALAEVTRIPGERLWQTYPEYFDRVLLDAPCSMEGLFKLYEPKTYTHWSAKKVKNLAKRERWLLRSAVSATKPGGTIVYSTCTFSRQENEEVVAWILEKEKGRVRVASIDNLDIPWTAAALPETKRILPDDYFEGFFIAKLRKVSSTV